MVSHDILFDGIHFIALDVLDTVKGNGITAKCPFVQFVDSSVKNASQNLEAIKNRIENSIKFEEKKEDLFTITLSVDEDYKNQLFR